MPEANTTLASRLAVGRPRRASGPGIAEVAVIAAGGAIGSVARYLLSAAFPQGPAGFPWAVFAVNVSGSFLLGALMVYLLDVWPPRRLLRLFLGVGLIGGYTTFSTYAGGILILLTRGAVAVADAYALSSVAAALAAVWLGMRAARLAASRRAASLPARWRTAGWRTAGWRTGRRP